MTEFAFEKLVVYQKAREFRRRIYKLAKLLPPHEFKLKVQMRDAARSLTNNLAEGHGRYTFKERVRFCIDSRGSLQALVNGYVVYLRRCAADRAKRKTVRSKVQLT